VVAKRVTMREKVLLVSIAKYGWKNIALSANLAYCNVNNPGKK